MTDTPRRRLITVCQYRSCQRSGSEAVLAAFQAQRMANVMVSACECQGQCSSGPTVRVLPDNTWYCQVRPEDVNTIMAEHIQGNQPVERLLHPRLHPRPDAYDSYR